MDPNDARSLFDGEYGRRNAAAKSIGGSSACCLGQERFSRGPDDHRMILKFRDDPVKFSNKLEILFNGLAKADADVDRDPIG